jgi:hypothetical protein
MMEELENGNVHWALLHFQVWPLYLP